MRRAAFALLLPLWIAPSCALPAASGRVVDRETRAPIADVRVVELWRAGRALSDVAATRHVRFATTDREGRFALPGEALATSLGRSDAPSYVLVHPRYGLVRVGETQPDEGALDFQMSRTDVTAQQSLAALCESPPREDWEREISAEFCPHR